VGGVFEVVLDEPWVEADTVRTGAGVALAAALAASETPVAAAVTGVF
jgi:hypothetical protein